MSWLLFSAKLCALVAGCLGAAYYLFLLPPRHPEGIPAVPFWVALLPLFRDVNQSDMYKLYMEGPMRAHGAVKLFFGAQWNVLVHHPALLADMFRREDIFQKSGNQKKIPHSVLAAFLGDNIISSHGDRWKLYQAVIKPALQASPELVPIWRNAAKLVELLDSQQLKAGPARGVAVQELLQRYTIANVATSLLQTDFGTLELDDARLHRLQSSVKKDIFNPVFMNFPFLDRLHIPSRTRARQQAARFTDELVAAVLDSQHKEDLSRPGGRNGLGDRLLAASQSGVLSEQQFRDNLTVTFVASQENPQLSLISTLYLLAKHPQVQDQLHQEVEASVPVSGTEPPSPPQSPSLAYETSLQDMPLLTSVLYESLRLFPPISQLINRRAAEPAGLGGLYVPRGTYLGYHCYSTHRDPAVWGADADDFVPGRWGSTTADIQKEYRQRRARADFVSFHGGRRACLGERFAILELKITLCALVQSFTWRLDPTWEDKMTPAGPLYPRALRLVFSRR